MKNKIKQLVNIYTNEKLKEAKKDYYKVVNELNKELYKDVVQMYDTFITQFYAYKTTSYIRHGQTVPGTQTGESLFRAQDFRIGGNYYNPTLIINFAPNDMGTTYQYDSAENVFDYVMHGIRFPYFNNLLNWTGTYRGKYFSYRGIPQHAFQLFGDTFNEIAERGFRKKWSKTKWGH